jgi:Tfp pilus assembly protein PilF
MKKKKAIILIMSAVCIVGLLTGYLFWTMNRADYYATVSRETSDTNEKVLALEKSLTLWEKPANILALADLYISIGRNDLSEQVMVGRGEVDILNKLGNLYLTENKVKEAENTFIKAKNKKINSDSLKGLMLVEAKYGDRGVAENYLSQLNGLDTNSANCYGSFLYLYDFSKSNNTFTKAKSCTLYGIDKYFSNFNETQSPLYLKLQASNLYYSQGFLNLAEKDILTILKEKNNYRDAHIMASKIYERKGDQTKANEHKQKVHELDPVAN